MNRSSGKNLLILLVTVVMVASGCAVNKDIMFKTPTDYTFTPPPDTIDQQFRIQVGDFLQFRLFANDGFKIIDLVSQGGNNQYLPNRLNITYLIEYDGTVKLPIIDRVKLIGRTVREAEIHLEELYAVDYNQPFVQLSVVNRRVVVFPGGGGTAEVVTLENNNTTLLEVLGLAGGVTNRANVSKVKVFRRNFDGSDRSVYQFDLSKIEGLKWADLVMQGDDIVYVQPNPDLAREILYEINPIITLLTSAVLVYGIVRSLR